MKRRDRSSRCFASIRLRQQSASITIFRTFKAFNAWGIPSVFVFDKRGALAAVVYPEDASPALIQTVLNGSIPAVEQEKAWDDPAGAEASFRAMREKAVKEQQQR